MRRLERFALITFLVLFGTTLALLLIWMIGSMVIVGGEMFDWWELGWVSDPSDRPC